ncbi:LamG-like jellyroll fold domain-containing protein [Cellulosimicrobium cellulans]
MSRALTLLAVAGLLAPLSVVSTPSAGTVEAAACHTEAFSGADASRLATECGHEVAITGAQTPWDTVYATPEGFTRVETSATAVRTDINGSWEPIDTTVIAGERGLEVVAPALEMEFSDGTGTSPLARIVRDGHELTFDVPFDLTPAVVQGSQITYPQILEGVDLVVSVDEDGTGFSEVLRVESPEAAANPALAELSFPVTTTQGLGISAAGGGFEAVDESGERVFTSPTPLMWDSSSSLADAAASRLTARTAVSSAALEDRAAAPLSGDRVAEMPADLGTGVVTVAPDPDMLTDPRTRWPIYIDPSISGSRNHWTVIRSGVPGTVAGYKFSGDQGMGLCDPGATSACTRSNDVYRLAWHFYGLDAIGTMGPPDIASATFSVYGEHSWDCTARGVQAYATGPVTASTTWNSHAGSWGRLLTTQNLAHKASCSNQRRVEFNVTEGAKLQAGENWQTLAIGLKASNESSMEAGWKRYQNDATLSVTYNRAPNAPLGMSTLDPKSSCVTGTDRPYIRSTTPELRVTVSDPDGGSLRGNFQVRRLNDNVDTFYANSTYLPSGGTHAMRVPTGKLADDTTYVWWASGTDTEGRHGTAGRCEFTVDVTRPDVLPGVTALAGQPGVYAEDQVSGGAGKTGQFQLSNGGVSDVESYKYSFTTDALNQSVTAAAGAKVAFTPAAGGSQRLYVQSVDRAGNTSDVRLYRFSVDHPSSSSRWSTDDGQGLVAANTVRPDLPLALSGPAQWVDGPLTEIGMSTTDRALSFSAGATASTAGPIVNVARDYAVLANVRLDQVTGTATAVSQDGQSVSGFKIGVRQDPQCPTGDGLCWGASTSSSDDAGAPVVTTLSGVPVTTGAWVMLAVVHDTSSAQLRLYVCDLGGREQPAAPASTLGMTRWTAAGAFRIGRGQAAGLPAEPWNGAIDHTRVFDSAVDVQEIRQQCSPTS